MKKWLVICMFLLIFAPKLGGIIDTMSMFALFIFFRGIGNLKNINLPSYITRPTTLYLSFAIIMVVYVLFLITINNLNDFYQFLRFGRVFVNVLGVFGLVVFYYKYYKNDYAKELMYHLWLCIIAHGTLMAIMFVIPSVNNFVITQLVQMDETSRNFESRLLGKRIGGLTSSWDAASGIQSLGLLLLPFVLNYCERSKKKKTLIYLTIPISFMAIAISGVTGLVMIFVVGFTFSIYNFFKVKKYILRFLLVITVAFFLLKISFDYVLVNNKEMIEDSSIGRTVFMLTQDNTQYSGSKRSRTATETVDLIFSKMYFLPSNESVFLFGRGGSGRSSDYVIKADPGIILNFHNLGFFFVIVLYSYCIKLFIRSIKIQKQSLYLGMAISSVLLTILVIDSKVMYLLARNSLSIMLFAYFAMFSIGKTNVEKKKVKK